MTDTVSDALRDLPEAPEMFERAKELVNEWKQASGKVFLSPEASRDLAGRIMLALIHEREESRANEAG
jgi:hypothetical protein